jgi:hypothetical protein
MVPSGCMILHFTQYAFPFDIVGTAAGLMQNCQSHPSPAEVFKRGGIFLWLGCCLNNSG